MVNGDAFKPATATLSDTATALANSRDIAGVSFNGSSSISIPYFNLTNKITAGNGISLTTGSASSSPSISSSQWTTTGNNIYNDGFKVGIGTQTVNHIFQIGAGGRMRIANTNADSTLIGTVDGDVGVNTRLVLYGSENSTYPGRIELQSHGTTGNNDAFGFNVNSVCRMHISAKGAVGIQDTGASYVIKNGLLDTGALAIGNTTQNYGGGQGAAANMAGLVLECLDNTEIVIHDAGNAYISFMRYTAIGNITIGRNMGVATSVFKGDNTTTWNITSDHRIKENIKNANLNICYNNVKNINLYRFNYNDAFSQGTSKDRTQLGFVAQQVNLYYPKSVSRGKRTLDDNREVPDIASMDVSQVNYTLFGAVKQLIRIVEKQSKRIKKLEEILNIVDDDEVENDADKPYVKIYCEGEVDIDTIIPKEPDSRRKGSSNTSNIF